MRAATQVSGRPMQFGPRSAVTGFLARTLLWFAAALTLWYLARDWVVVPPAWLAEHAMLRAFPEWVRGADLAGQMQTLQTSLTVVAPDGRIGEATVEAGLLKYCYGTALFVALLLASWPHGVGWKLPLGIAALVPFQAFSICADWLLHVATRLGPSTAVQTGFGPVTTNLIGAAYQLGFLMLPTLVPVLLWLALDRKLVATVLLEGALSGFRAR